MSNRVENKASTPLADGLSQMRKAFQMEVTPAYRDAMALCRRLEVENADLKSQIATMKAAAEKEAEPLYAEMPPPEEGAAGPRATVYSAEALRLFADQTWALRSAHHAALYPESPKARDLRKGLRAIQGWKKYFPSLDGRSVESAIEWLAFKIAGEGGYWQQLDEMKTQRLTLEDLQTSAAAAGFTLEQKASAPVEVGNKSFDTTDQALNQLLELTYSAGAGETGMDFGVMWVESIEEMARRLSTLGPVKALLQHIDYAMEHGWPLDAIKRIAAVRLVTASREQGQSVPVFNPAAAFEHQIGLKWVERLLCLAVTPDGYEQGQMYGVRPFDAYRIRAELQAMRPDAMKAHHDDPDN